MTIPHVSFVAFFELLEHDVESEIVKHKVTGILVELAEHAQRSVVIGVDEGQVLDVKQRQDVFAIVFVDRDSRVTCRMIIKVKFT